MKRPNRTLALRRETLRMLRPLEEAYLAFVQGGTETAICYGDPDIPGNSGKEQD